MIAPRSAGPLSGTGLRYLPVPHAGNDTDSAEEARTIAELVRSLLETQPTWIDRDGREASMTVDDIVIVAPYNAHVGAIERAAATAGLPPLFAGTVDKFQGQEAPISIYAMGTSSPEDAPRGMEFLYSLNRLNVATSRAKCVAAIVCRPRWSGSRAGRRARCGWPTACAWPSSPRRRRPRRRRGRPPPTRPARAVPLPRRRRGPPGLSRRPPERRRASGPLSAA